MTIRASCSSYIFSSLLVLVASGQPAHSADVDAAYDCWHTASGEAQVELDLPADFLEPGSPAQVHLVPLVGRDLPQVACPDDSNVEIVWLDQHGDPVAPNDRHGVVQRTSVNAFDTVVRRLDTATFNGASQTEDVDIEIIELSLESVSPVLMQHSGGTTQLYTIFVTLDGAVAQAQGLLSLTSNLVTEPYVQGTATMPNLPIAVEIQIEPVGGGSVLTIQETRNMESGAGNGTFSTFPTDVPGAAPWLIAVALATSGLAVVWRLRASPSPG